MDNEKIKEMLLSIRSTELDFTVIQTGKESKRVNGFYKPDTHEIFLHNKNFDSENLLVYTAVHEYTHHLIDEQEIKLNGGAYVPNAKVHTAAFWALFQELLAITEEKGYYKLDISSSPELVELTKKIKSEYLTKNAELMQEFGKLLIKAQELCEKSSIRYEDYLDRVLCLPRNSAHDMTKVSVKNINPQVGYDNMKMIASLKKPEEMAKATDKILSGTAPVTVRALMKQKSNQTEDPREKLEKEKNRLEKTIAQLQQRLEFVEESLENM